MLGEVRIGQALDNAIASHAIVLLERVIEARLAGRLWHVLLQLRSWLDTTLGLSRTPVIGPLLIRWLIATMVDSGGQETGAPQAASAAAARRVIMGLPLRLLRRSVAGSSGGR